MVLLLADHSSNWNLEMLVFEERRKREYQGKNNFTSIIMVLTLEIEPGSH